MYFIEPASDHASSPLKSPFGEFVLHAYDFDGAEHVALVYGDPLRDTHPLVRVQSSCLTGTAVLSELCDCRQQLHAAMDVVAVEGAGVVLYMAQEGRSHGLVEKVAQLRLIAEGADTVEAARLRGRGEDLRDYHHAARILQRLIGSRSVRLLTNNPAKLEGMERAGAHVAERVPLETVPTAGNVEYLRVKKRRMGHLLTEV